MLEAGHPVAADDQMVVNLDVKGSAGLHNLFRDLDVGAAGGGVAGRMIVDQDQGAGRQLQGASHDLAGIDGGVIDRAPVLHLVQDQLVLLVEVVFHSQTPDRTSAMTAQAYIYRRFSADEQEKGAGDTLNRQKERCEAYAAENGWQVTEVMTDKGRSAFKGEHLYPEAELGQFVERVTRGEISSGSVLIAERLDRLSRRPVNEAMAWIHAMTSAGIKIAIADSRNVFGVNQDMGSFLATAIQAATGHEESRKKSEQTTLSKQKLWKLAEVREGKWANLANKIPSWLKRKPGCDGFEVIEERADVVRLIYQMSADGVGVNTITRQLNEGINGKVIPPFAKAIKHKGVPHKWGRSGVRQLLKSPTVEGDFRPATGAHKGRVIHGFYPRIVDADIVSLARADLTARRKVAGKSAASGSSNIFAGITSCGHCGRRAFLTTSTQKGKPYPYLRCEAAGERRCENVGGYSYRAFENTVCGSAWKRDPVSGVIGVE